MDGQMFARSRGDTGADTGADDRHDASAPLGAPALSVVVIMFSAREQLMRCLDALAIQARSVRLEVIVPHDDTLTMPDELLARYPGVQLLPLPGLRPPAELRAAAVAASRAPIIALLEDHCTPAVDWCVQVLAAHASSHAAVGGAIEKGFPPGRTRDTALNWALYLTDYSRYMRPRPCGTTHALSDCNVSYKRAALEGVRTSWATEFHENVVNHALSDAGHTLWFTPDLMVYEQRPLHLRLALRDRYTFGRLFGSTRVTRTPFPVRLARAVVAVLMPPLLVYRVWKNLATRGRHQLQFLRCVPWLLVVSSAWMWGEAVGYLTGVAGPSLSPTRRRADGRSPASGTQTPAAQPDPGR